MLLYAFCCVCRQAPLDGVQGARLVRGITRTRHSTPYIISYALGASQTSNSEDLSRKRKCTRERCVGREWERKEQTKTKRSQLAKNAINNISKCRRLKKTATVSRGHWGIQQRRYHPPSTVAIQNRKRMEAVLQLHVYAVYFVSYTNCQKLFPHAGDLMKIGRNYRDMVSAGVRRFIGLAMLVIAQTVY